MANDMIRMSGMNSGLDTESIINALTANTKLKATKQERNVLKYEAQQEAYRDIITKLNNLKKSYFDILNKDSYLSGSSMWNKYSSKAIVDSTGAEMAGVSVATTINSQPGEYNIKVTKTAKQASIKGGSLSSSAKLDSGISSEANAGKDFGMTVTVGDVEKNITFKAGATQAETIDNINTALEEAFGESNLSVGNAGNKGMVYVDDNGNFKSRNGKGITLSGAGLMQETNTLSFASAKTGRNVLSFQIGDETLNVSFQSLAKDYFSDITEKDSEGHETGYIALPPEPDDDASDEDKAAYNTALAKLETIAESSSLSLAELKERASIAYNVQEDYKESVRYESFKTYISGTDEAAHKDVLYAGAEADNKKDRLTKWYESDEKISAAYNAYKTTQENEGATVDDIYTWTRAQYTSSWSSNNSHTDGDQIWELHEAYDKLENKYNGTDESYEVLEPQYVDYVFSDLDASVKTAWEAHLADNGANSKTLDQWLDEDSGISDEQKAAIKSFDDWKTEHQEKRSWKLDKDTFTDSNYDSSMFTEYKKSVYTEPTAGYGITTSKLLDHFTESALKNSIGNLETSNGTKLSVSYSNGSASITAADANGDPVAISMTVGRDSVNKAADLGTTSGDATTSISQITNKTLISDLGVAADEDGNYTFSINGKSFSFASDTTVNDMMKSINASDAGVKMSYSSLNNEFTVTANKYGVDSKIDLVDTSGLLTAVGITSANFEAGNNLEVNINGTDYEAEGNSIEADGTTFTISSKAATDTAFTVSIEKDTSATMDLIKKFVDDYNSVIKDVYKYLDEKPEKDYYFLTDADKEDLDLSEKQEEKWEEKAKKGILYHDSITTTVMSSLRTALMGSVTGLDGNTFSLASLGITTSTDYNEHGKLVIDESKLKSAIENNADDIQKLFTDSENGIMKKFSAALDAGVSTTGENKGSLIRKAGLATGKSSTDNEIYRMIKNTKNRITSLNKRYESEQNRLWKRYSAMESMLGELNNQQSSFSSYFMQ